MVNDNAKEADAWRQDSRRLPLSEMTRARLGLELQALYEPVIDEPLDPRLAELMRQLDADRGQ